MRQGPAWADRLVPEVDAGIQKQGHQQTPGQSAFTATRTGGSGVSYFRRLKRTPSLSDSIRAVYLTSSTPPGHGPHCPHHQCHRLTLGEIQARRPAPGHVRGRLANGQGACGAEGPRSKSPQAKSTRAPPWARESEWRESLTPLMGARVAAEGHWGPELCHVVLRE